MHTAKHIHQTKTNKNLNEYENRTVEHVKVNEVENLEDTRTITTYADFTQNVDLYRFANGENYAPSSLKTMVSKRTPWKDILDKMDQNKQWHLDLQFRQKLQAKIRRSFKGTNFQICCLKKDADS